jgi:hypothetical protein
MKKKRISFYISEELFNRSEEMMRLEEKKTGIAVSFTTWVNRALAQALTQKEKK